MLAECRQGALCGCELLHRDFAGLPCRPLQYCGTAELGWPAPDPGTVEWREHQRLVQRNLLGGKSCKMLHLFERERQELAVQEGVQEMAERMAGLQV